MKILSLFSGIGAFEKALDNLGIPYELEAYCEIDKYASKSYAAIHGVPEAMNLGDITNVDESKLPKDIDLLTYGFPCQDISVAGNLKGMFNEDGTKTRSGLFFDALRIIEATKPKIAIAENVKNLTSKRFAEQFKIVLTSLEQAGYNNYWHILNAKDFGIPQNRERVFIVSIRKDIDNGTFQFPEGFPLELRLKDLLETEVDDKFYVSDKGVAFITNPMRLRKKYTAIDGDVSLCLTAKGQSNWTGTFISDSEEAQCIEAANLNHYRNDQMNRVYSPEGIAPTIMTKTGGGRETKILESDHIRPLITIDGDVVKVREATKQGYAEAHEGDSINLEQPSSQTRRGRVGKQMAQTLNTTCHLQAVVEPNVLRQERSEYGKQIRKAYDAGEVNEKWAAMKEWVPRTDGITNTLSTVQKDNLLHDGSLRIRRLTPKECFRLMGFDDSDFEKAESVVSNTQLYKQAGNSIVVPVVEHIIKSLIDSGITFNRRSENNVGENTLEESCV